MQKVFPERSNLEKFGKKIFFLLVENFPETYYTGGTVRDFLLGRKTSDIDIATAARPEQVAAIFAKHKIICSMDSARFGVVTAKQGILRAEITTFRTEQYAGSRYPRIRYTKSAKQDSTRRDFTVNALYFSQKTGALLDFHDGVKDLRLKKITFIGNPEQRITEDPLRIVRAFRFMLELNFSLSRETEIALVKKLRLLNSITATRLQKEINKVTDSKRKQKLLSLLVYK